MKIKRMKIKRMKIKRMKIIYHKIRIMGKKISLIMKRSHNNIIITILTKKKIMKIMNRITMFLINYNPTKIIIPKEITNKFCKKFF
jgi:hypothetical protein